MQPVIKIENLSKMYRLGTIGTGTISHDLNRWWHKVRGKDDPYLKIGEANVSDNKSDSGYVWALKDINLEVMPGEVLGIIGKNGAGKSTLLKILSRVTGPTTGRISYTGRIGSLLEVGTGFHPELTGRENIFLNGAILGMTKVEISRKLDEIVDFAGVERYIDTPVKRYSSGMRVRLGFAVAAFLEPDILVVDEVLAVGDAEFQKKAIGKMQNVSHQEGRTILFVSHNMATVNSLCQKGIILKNGEIAYEGIASEAVEKYLYDNSYIELTDVFNKLSSDGLVKIEFGDGYYKFGEPININMEWYFPIDKKARVISIRIENIARELVCGYNTLVGNLVTKLEDKGKYTINFIGEGGIPPGKYYVNIGSYVRPHTREYYYENILQFEVSEIPFNKEFQPNIFGNPMFYTQSEWKIDLKT